MHPTVQFDSAQFAGASLLKRGTNALERIIHTYPKTLVWLCSCMISVAVFAVMPHSAMRTVSPDYEPDVQNLLGGHGLTDASGELDTRYPPLYALLLALLRMTSSRLGVDELWLLVAFATVCLAAAAVAVYGTASFIVGPRLAIVSALLFAIHPQLLFGLIAPLSETPFVALLSGTVWLFLATWTQNVPSLTMTCLVGVLTGIGMLIRPAGMFVPFVMALVIAGLGPLKLQARLRYATVLLVGMIAALIPWEAYILQNRGTLIVVSSGGVPTIRDGLSLNNKPMRSRIWIPAGATRISDEVWREYATLTDYSSIVSVIGAQWRKNPLGVLELYSYKAIRSWYGTDSQQGQKELVNAVVAAVYLLPSVAGAVVYFRRRRAADAGAGVFLVALVFCFWGVTTVTLSIVRYMVPALAFLCAFIPMSLPTRISGQSIGWSRQIAN